MKVVKSNALTVDVEDAVNQAMRNFFSTDMAPTARVYDNTQRLLDLFSEYDSKATFFILGEVAKAFPALIKEIASRGHELGIHGYTHTNYSSLSKKDIKNEIIKAKLIVQDISGIEVIGHRAPEFSINNENSWILEFLADEGFKYDSSIFPINGSRYGWPGYKKDMALYKLENGKQIVEAPLSAISILGKDIPACGGGYLRIFPYYYTKLSFRIINKSRPANVYIHPYEIDPPPFQNFYMEAIGNTSLKNQIQMKLYWFNRKSVIPKLKKMLQVYHFDTLQNIIRSTLNIEI